MFHELSSDQPGKAVAAPGTESPAAPSDSVPATSDDHVPVGDKQPPREWYSKKAKDFFPRKKGKGKGKGKKGRGKGGQHDLWRGAPPFRPRSGVPVLW